MVSLLPVGLMALLLVITFSFGLESVWSDAVPRQADLLRLDSLVREYQAEVREFALERLPETSEEIDEIERELPEILADLSRHGPQAAQLVSELSPLIEAMTDSRKRLNNLAGLHEPLNTSISPPDLEEELEAFEETESVLEDRIDGEREVAAGELARAMFQFRRSMAGVTGFGIVLGLLLALGLARWLNTPLSILKEASERIMDGDYRAGERLNSHDELGQLAAGFDRAATDIRHLMQEKQEHLDTLERNQHQLVQSGKLAAVGELAAGVAHELNNPLSAVLTYSVLIRERAEKVPAQALEPMPKLIERLQLIETAAKRCKTIADNLLTFARQEDSEKGPVNLDKLVDDSLDLMKPMLKRKKVTVERPIEPGLAPTFGNATQLQQIVVNLVGNALHAVDVGGQVRVAARAGDDDQCELSVADNGPGIEPELADRIFEPFVTSKPPTEGTGLGLSIVYGIVQDHGGRIEVESSNEGTTFKVYLPLAQQPQENN